MRRQLAQSRPANTTETSVLSNARPWVVDLVIVANTTNNSANFSIYHDADGTTYDETTTLYFNVPLAGQDVAYIEFPAGIPNTDATGNLAVKTSTGDALNFTVYGTILGERL